MSPRLAHKFQRLGALHMRLKTLEEESYFHAVRNWVSPMNQPWFEFKLPKNHKSTFDQTWDDYRK